MSKINWQEQMGWGEDQTEELRLTGYAYLRQGKYDIALDFFNGLVVLDPNNLYDRQTLGALYLQLDMPAEAFEHLDYALKLEGDHTPTLINLCKSLFMLGKKDEGLKLAKILEKDKNPKIASTAKALLLAFGD